jgi:2-succinyl-6-hydroxy-2,4-cyclohexadiene-1-carboxylate synthase
MIKGQIGKYCFTYCLEGSASHPALLFLHGFMGDRQEFNQHIRSLSSYFYCIVIDLPAHGDSSLCGYSYSDDTVLLEPYYTMPAIVDLLIKFLDFLGIQRCTPVGYSMGGRIALYLAVHFPQYCDRLILESTSAGLTTPSAKSDRLAQDLQIATKLATATPSQFEAFLDDWYRQPIFANLHAHPHFAELRDRRLTQRPLELAKCLYSLSVGRQRSLWQDLPQIEMPILLITGALDSKFVQIHQQMARSLPSVQLEVIADCGHNVHFEQPQIFTALIQKFVL